MLLGIPGEHNQQVKNVVIWLENIPALQIFQQLTTQWRIAPMGGIIGLDYSAIIPVIKMMVKKKKRASLFLDIQEIEFGYLAGIKKR